MRNARSPYQEVCALALAGPRLIAAGLMVLLASCWIPALPALTAMAVLALGATYATLDRLRNSPLLAAGLMLHGATYATLYALFVGAMLHSGMKSATPHLSLVLAADLVVSWLFLVLAARQVATAIRRI